jgi:DNA polymerase-4
MDAFYASVEQRDRPELRGRPVIVGGPKDARGVVSAASYEARRFGVRSAMPLRTAARLCPQGVFVPVRMEAYLEASRTVFAIFERYAPLVEPLSVDEAFLDLTGCERLFGDAVAAARALRSDIRAACGLTASVGVAPNKFVAKIASDLEKPDGLVVVAPDAVEAFLAPRPVERMWGLGPRGAAAARGAGLRTFADLARAPRRTLEGLFGGAGARLGDLARGLDARPVVTERAPRSLGHETTFSEDVSDRDVQHATLVHLTERVAARLRRHGLRATTVTIKVRYRPFRTVTRRRTMTAPTHATAPLLACALALFRETPADAPPVRLLGVSTSGFRAQTVLFGDGGPEAAALDAAVDRVRERFGAAALARGCVFKDEGRSG